MKKRKSAFGRRALSMALSLVMCLGMLQVTAFATEDGTAATEPTAQTETAPDTNVDVDTNTDVDVDTNTDVDVDTNTDVDVDTDTDVDVDTDTDVDVDTDTDVDVDTNTDVDVDTDTDVDVDTDTDVDVDTDTDVDVDTDTDVDVDTDTKPSTPNYATKDELEAAYDAVSEALEGEDVKGGIAAIDKYLSIYNSLSPEDKAANAEAYAGMLAYQETLKGSLEGIPDPEIEPEAAKWHTVTLVPASTNSYGSKITSAKVKVGQRVNGYEVTSVSGTTIKVKAWGDLYGDFFLPRAADLWNGAVKSDYVIWAGVGSSDRTEGGSAMLPQSNASAYYYFNTAGSVGGGGSYFWTFNLKYDANGGNGAPETQTYGTDSKYTKSHTFTISTTEPKRTGYTFKGWSDTPNGPANYQGGGTCLVMQTVSGYNGGSVTQTLYAIWEKDAEDIE